MSNKNLALSVSDRRTVMKAGAGILGTLIGLNMVSTAVAQDGTPEAGHSLAGTYAVVRTYQMVEDADTDALVEIVQNGYVPIIEEVEGFLLYTTLYNEDTHVWTAIAYFTDKAGSDASTEAAADYVVSADLGSYFVDPSPEVIDGTVNVAAGGPINAN